MACDIYPEQGCPFGGHIDGFGCLGECQECGAHLLTTISNDEEVYCPECSERDADLEGIQELGQED